MDITAQDLYLKYKDGHSDRTILDHISVSFRPSTVHVICGPSGSGKSSMIYLLSTLRKPTSGKVFLDDMDLTAARSPEQVRYDHFGFVFQQHFLIPYLNVMENVCIAKKEEDLSVYALDTLERLGIAELAKKMPAELSGGERQRVAIARALVKKPVVIFADEPTASLDRENAVKIFSLLREAAKEHTVIMTTHDLSLLQGDERVLRLENGTATELN